MSITTDPEYNRAAPSVTNREYASYLAATNIVNAAAAGTDSDPMNGALATTAAPLKNVKLPEMWS